MSKPFYRSLVIAGLIRLAHAKPIEEQAEAFANIPAYVSRGKGKNKPFIKSWFSKNAYSTTVLNSANQVRETMRRRMQSARLILKGLPA